MDDALFAKLMGMGFEVEQIQQCYEALSRASTAFTLQKATDWYLISTRCALNRANLLCRLLDKPASPSGQAKPSSNTLVLTPPTDHVPSGSGGSVAAPNIHRPVSSSRDLSALASEEAPASRYCNGTH